MNLLFLRRLTLEPLPLVLENWADVQAFKELEMAHMVEGIVSPSEGGERALVEAVTPRGIAYLASTQRRTMYVTRK